MDLRTPIAWLFSVLGLTLAVWGRVSGESHLTRSGDNINFWWGVVILSFGLAMGYFARRAAAGKSSAK